MLVLVLVLGLVLVLVLVLGLAAAMVMPQVLAACCWSERYNTPCSGIAWTC